MHVYLDDLFIYSDSIQEDEKHLALVFGKLYENQLFMKAEKVQLYTDKMNCLHHLPQNYNDTEKFLGLVNYLIHFLSDVTAYTAPLSEMTKHGWPFYWCPLYSKFTDSQHNYCVFETETLAMLEAILNCHIYVLSNSQMQWIEYLSCFDFDITYVKDLPLGCKKEAKKMVVQFHVIKPHQEFKCFTGKHETQDLEAEEMKNAGEHNKPEPIQSSNNNPTVFDSRDNEKNLQTVMDMDPTFISDVLSLYSSDPIFSKVLKASNDHPCFFIEKGLI
ncbi:DNA/RNA polymerase [Guyanagaster necrorhizus]|uniref:DNA/RNA polymerase n=1 Tax=Guyanagaster necrorhizus TaxID=856835 RepID=A0A9P8ARJ5_9AGAR|nr:DNA/RNA polymerase [Guyanagaster necrorhizus MCA 3950]KAG7445458.1 DNA/RNA polymerase [Guyanagaster necrorhizus MCA 3950]